MARWRQHLTRFFAAGAVRKNRRRPVPCDLRLGLVLLCDRRIPTARRALAWLYGGAATALVLMVEAALTAGAAAAAGVPWPGLNAVVAILEAAAGPALFGAWFVTRLAPSELVVRARIERLPVIPLRAPAPDMARSAASSLLLRMM